MVDDDKFIADMVEGRKSTSVLKTKLISFRGVEPNKKVFAFEGIDDKIVYFSWVQRVRPDLDYEPFPCRSKYEVLQFRKMLERDLGELANDVYFFIDRDFDEDMGFGAHDRQYMTSCYSVENYLVCESVINKILMNEFSCDGLPDVRAKIVEMFTKAYDEFLSASEVINLTIYVARKLNIEIDIPKGVGFADISINSVSSSSDGFDIELPVDVNGPELSYIVEEFKMLDARCRYRGKFAYSFLNIWIDRLHEEYKSRKSSLFEEVISTDRARRGEITLGGLAGKSPIPADLAEFLSKI